MDILLITMVIFFSFILGSVIIWHLSVFFISLAKGKMNIQNNGVKTTYKYAIIICAHDEERVLRNCIQSVRKMDFPMERWTCFVLADNCTDRTEWIAKEEGAVVIKKEDKMPSTKGKALKAAISYINCNYAGEYQVICVLDSDNTVESDFLTQMDGCFSLGNDIVCGNRKSSNCNRNIITSCYSLYWSMVTNLYGRGHNGCNINSIISGTGFAFKADILENNEWSTETMSEDVEFYVQMSLKKKKIRIQPNAVFYDQQPENLPTMFTQLHRWMTGTAQVFKKYWQRCMGNFLTSPDRNSLDLLLTIIMCNCLGVYLPVLLMFAINQIRDGISLFTIGYVLVMILGGYILSCTVAGLSMWIGGQHKKRKFLSIIAYPFFIMVISLMTVVAIIHPQKTWKKIIHK